MQYAVRLHVFVCGSTQYFQLIYNEIGKYLCMFDGSWMVIIILTFLFLKGRRLK
jgi:hypothetical protein